MTGVRSRFQIARTSPEVVLDVAHNPQAATALARTCGERPVAGSTFAVVGMMRDKAIEETLSALTTTVDVWYLGSLPDPRGADAATLEDALTAVDSKSVCHRFADVASAYHAALSHAHPEDRILVFGSFVTVGAIMPTLS